MKTDTIVIIPAYNEENSIVQVVSAIKGLYPNFAIAVIDDGSSDNTATLAAQEGAIVLSIHLIWAMELLFRQDINMLF